MSSDFQTQIHNEKKGKIDISKDNDCTQNRYLFDNIYTKGYK